MICYDEKGGSFPFTYEEIELMQQVLSEKIRDMENNVDAKDPRELPQTVKVCGFC